MTPTTVALIALSGIWGETVDVQEATAYVIEQSLLDVKPVPPWQVGDPIRFVPRRHADDPLLRAPIPPVNPVSPGDPLADSSWQPGAATKALGMPLINIDENNGAQGFVGGFPPDTVGDVGLRYFIQSTNGSGGSVVRVFEKSNGQMVGNAFQMSSLAGASTSCRNSAAGDPVILFDELAQRWMISEFTSPGPNRLCVYVSRSSDPINGGWYNYEFTAPSFPDYPHYGVWHDAYYVASNESAGSAVYALERDQMLVGGNARIVRFLVPSLPRFGFQTTTPADHDGQGAPLGPGLFLRHRDDEAHDPGSNNPGGDRLELFEFNVNWNNPQQSGISNPIAINVAEFDSDLCGLSGTSCLPQPGNGVPLDPLREVIMWRLQYRNFNTHETLVGNLATDVGGDRAGIRFFELRRMGGPGNPWTVFQQGTLAPNDGDSRFMGSAAMDASGNIAIGYSVTGRGTFPSLRYVGRAAGDPAGQLTSGERTIVNGSASQTQADRWGDYAALSVDPVDGCTFWFTSMYQPANLWSTQIAAFKFDECGSNGFNLAGTNLTQSVCLAPGSDPLMPITVSANAIGGFSAPIALSLQNAPTGFSASFVPQSINPGQSSTATINVGGGAAAGRNTFRIAGMAAGVDNQSLAVNVDVTVGVPGAVNATAPANGAMNVLATPTFRWGAVASATQYRFQLATDPGFTNVLIDQTQAGTNFAPSVKLNDNATYYWRVRAINGCGPGQLSATRSFTTAALMVSGCPAGTTATQVFFDDIEPVAMDGWGVFGEGWFETAVPGLMGTAWLVEDIDFASIESIAAPFVDLPANAASIELRFNNVRNIEGVGSDCADGGVLEYTFDDMNFFLIGDRDIGDDPYTGPILTGFDNPFGGVDAWCGATAATTATVADVSDLAGLNVSFLWTLASDESIPTPDTWGVDDVEIVACVTGNAPDDLIHESGFEDGEGVTRRVQTRGRPSPLGGRTIERR